jgi:RNA-directed DNA polymerase
LREPRAGTQSLDRIGLNDKDYIVYIWQLRRYLYGHLAEHDVRRLARGVVPCIQLRGVIARFPLVDDDSALRALDSWICTTTWLALRRRAELLAPLVGSSRPRAWDLARSELVGFTSVSASTGEPLDLRLPSALRMARVVREAVRTHGSSVVGQGVDLYGRHRD